MHLQHPKTMNELETMIFNGDLEVIEAYQTRETGGGKFVATYILKNDVVYKRKLDCSKKRFRLYEQRFINKEE
jgi:hypothetical protein